MKYGISAIAFDIDGTLYPSWRFNLRIIPFLLKHFNFMSAFNKTRKDIRFWQKKNPDKVLSNFFISKQGYQKKSKNNIRADLWKVF